MFVLRVNLSSPPRRLNYPVPCGPQTQAFHLAFMVSRIVKPIGFSSKSQILNFVFRFGGPFFRWFVLSSPWIDRFDSQNCPKSFTLPKLRRLLILANLTELPPDGYYHFFSTQPEAPRKQDHYYQVYSQCSQASVRLCLPSFVWGKKCKWIFKTDSDSNSCATKKVEWIRIWIRISDSD